MSSNLFHLFADLGKEITIPNEGIVSRTVYNDEQMKVVLFGFSQGSEMSKHTAAMPAIMHFLSGEARITLGEQESDATAGTWVHMTANLPHSIVAKTPVTMLLLLLKSATAATASGTPAGAEISAGEYP